MTAMDPPSHLTVKERALLHLYIEGTPDWGIEYPQSLTQEGIAKAVGVSRAHISQSMISLEKEKHVKGMKSRVKNCKRKRKTYILTERGRRKVKLLHDDLMNSGLPTMGVESEETITFSKALENTNKTVISLYLEWDENGFVKLKDNLVKLKRAKAISSGGDKDHEQLPLRVEKRSNFWLITAIFLFTSSLLFLALSLITGQPFLCVFSVLILFLALVVGKLYINSHPDHIGSGNHISGHFEIIIGFFFMALAPLLLIVGALYLEEFSICLASLFSLVLGTSFATYYTSNKGNDNPFAQGFSTLVFVNVTVLIYFFTYGRFGEFGLSSDFYVFIFLVFSISCVTLVPLKTGTIHVDDLPYVVGPVLIIYGFISYMFPYISMSSPIPLYWIPAGFFILDMGFRWYPDAKWQDDILLGVSLFLIILFSTLFLEGTIEWMLVFICILWICLLSIFVISRFLDPDIRSRIYSNIWNGLPVTLALVFAFVALLLFMGGRYVEGMIESLLAGLFILEIRRRGAYRHKSFVYGVILTIPPVLTMLYFIL